MNITVRKSFYFIALLSLFGCGSDSASKGSAIEPIAIAGTWGAERIRVLSDRMVIEPTEVVDTVLINGIISVLAARSYEYLFIDGKGNYSLYRTAINKANNAPDIESCSYLIAIGSFEPDAEVSNSYISNTSSVLFYDMARMALQQSSNFNAMINGVEVEATLMTVYEPIEILEKDLNLCE